jgi:hypothetical protein
MRCSLSLPSTSCASNKPFFPVRRTWPTRRSAISDKSPVSSRRTAVICSRPPVSWARNTSIPANTSADRSDSPAMPRTGSMPRDPTDSTLTPFAAALTKNRPRLVLTSAPAPQNSCTESFPATEGRLRRSNRTESPERWIRNKPLLARMTTLLPVTFAILSMASITPGPSGLWVTLPSTTLAR